MLQRKIDDDDACVLRERARERDRGPRRAVPGGALTTATRLPPSPASRSAVARSSIVMSLAGSEGALLASAAATGSTFTGSSAALARMKPLGSQRRLGAGSCRFGAGSSATAGTGSAGGSTGVPAR